MDRKPPAMVNPKKSIKAFKSSPSALTMHTLISKTTTFFDGKHKNDEGPWIMLHILWTKENKLLLYVGKTLNIHEQTGRHCDSEHRRKYPSLHYNIRDPGSITGDSFVHIKF
ncbi:hypothetical protein N7491_004910 [Penicillium cf. griseofulvum]|uniref:Uncharacterized protein n=1 Tax=Penicillium cf. griseofulvum TaxID=2972120 RepID=A0A9W9M475_9EURO|nr:hypothetical protein N7472_007604 [Penicillium cf. griseofulvum]KAJ5434315.1 hypothetical protein N7491_004910 [Penicillium cf. griseofulvum]KAJ5452146.1 hypothetical protein N7445_000329 [Penicillium cf. griseofulvum]